jgi:regulator of RNase E activity RraA
MRPAGTRTKHASWASRCSWRALAYAIARARASEISCGQPVTIGGVLIKNGYLVVGDGSVVVVVRTVYAADERVRVAFIDEACNMVEADQGAWTTADAAE